MPFDQTTRNRLAKFVGDARSLLTEEFTRQLQHEYGLDPLSGEVTPLEKLTALDDARRETARILRETLDYYLSNDPHPLPRFPEWAKAALERIVREQAFTVLNRLCALRMAEARGFLIESVGRGYQSKGFQLYARLAGAALGETGDTYRSYLFSILDEFALDLPVLFDRFSPQGRLFPRDGALLRLLERINDPEIAPLWAEDETIGWIYQYFNSKEERQKMHAESRAPRNSRELAVRNQFFTPRYVVEFLTDNTLGRIWHEMTRGETALKDTCRYLVRRPREVFLGSTHISHDHAPDWVKAVLEKADFPALPETPSIDEIGDFALLLDGYEVSEGFGYGEALEFANRWIQAQEKVDLLPTDSLELWLILFAYQRGAIRHGFYSSEEEDPTQQNIRRVYDALRRALQNPPEDLPQEELLKQPVYIPRRPLKDPREIKLLDPACGSMHFGLYAFDLFERIYEEAWELEERLGENALWRMADLAPLHQTYSDKAAFLQDVPRLIIERNLHGIDIDPRTVQIAGLSLWLRAQKSWQAQGLKPHQRPQIRKANIVCAESMPGDRQMLEEFLATLNENRLEALVRKALHLPHGRKVRVTKAMAEALAKLVQRIWQEMELAGEAGSLLKIEETLRDAIAAARKASVEKAPLFSVLEYGIDYQTEEQKRQSSNTNYSYFWSYADALVLAALQEYIAEIDNGGSYRRRLFAEDAAQGFALIDLLRNNFDVVLMNPPFGDPSRRSKSYIENSYKRTKGDILANFLERALLLVTGGGKVGTITNRTCFFLTTQSQLREEVLQKHGFVELMADFGHGVLDAMVETAAYTLSRKQQPGGKAIFVRCLMFTEKEIKLQNAINALNENKISDLIFIINPDEFSRLNGSPYCYWISTDVIRKIARYP